MINAIALTQFAFLALGVAALKILLKANTDSEISSFLQALNHVSLWLFFVPVVWIAFASTCQMVNKGALNLKVARGVGIVVAAVCFLFLVGVTFFVSR